MNWRDSKPLILNLIIRPPAWCIFKKVSLPRLIFQSPGRETLTIIYNVVDPMGVCGELYHQFADRFAPITWRIRVHSGYTKYIFNALEQSIGIYRTLGD